MVKIITIPVTIRYPKDEYNKFCRWVEEQGYKKTKVFNALMKLANEKEGQALAILLKLVVEGKIDLKNNKRK